MEINSKIILPLNENSNKRQVPLIRTYVAAMLMTSGRKNCSSMSRETGINVKTLYKFLDTANENIPLMRDHLFNAACKLGQEDDSACLTIDFSQVEKPYAQRIEGLGYDHNGCSKQVEKGLTIGVLAISGAKETIPFDFVRWTQQKYCIGVYVKKNDLMKVPLRNIQYKLKFKYLLADGAFATTDFMKFLQNEKIKFIMRIARNRTIENGYGAAQIQHHRSTRLRKNEKIRLARAYYKGMLLYFITHKRKGKNGTSETVHYVSNDELAAKDYIRWYNRRFTIEKLFRTDKQSLGLKECQALTRAKQDAHIWATFLAYHALEKEKILKQKKCPEDIIHLVRRREPRSDFNYVTNQTAIC